MHEQALARPWPEYRSDPLSLEARAWDKCATFKVIRAMDDRTCLLRQPQPRTDRMMTRAEFRLLVVHSALDGLVTSRVCLAFSAILQGSVHIISDKCPSFRRQQHRLQPRAEILQNREVILNRLHD